MGTAMGILSGISLGFFLLCMALANGCGIVQMTNINHHIYHPNRGENDTILPSVGYQGL